MQEIQQQPATLMTIGYEGAAIDDFVATLQQVDIEVLVDVRDVPVSRKPGFSKRILAEALNNVGIRYVHFRELGNPKPGREAARQGDIRKFERIFRNHLARDDSQDSLREAIQIATQNRAVLLCFEMDHNYCHRAIVAEAIAERGPFEIHHQRVIQGLASQQVRDYINSGIAHAHG